MSRPKGSKNKPKNDLANLEKVILDRAIITDPSTNHGVILTVLITNDVLESLAY